MFTPPLPIYQFIDNTIPSVSSGSLDYIYGYLPISSLLQHRKELALSVKKWKEMHTPIEGIVIVTKAKQSMKQRLKVNDI